MSQFVPEHLPLGLIRDANAYVLAFLRGNGFNVLDIQGLNLATSREIDCIEPKFLYEFAAALDRPDADAVFVCCGALRAIDIVGELERQLSKPVIVSNQAMMWDCLRQAGISDRISGYGRLLTMDSLGLAA